MHGVYTNHTKNLTINCPKYKLPQLQIALSTNCSRHKIDSVHKLPYVQNCCNSKHVPELQSHSSAYAGCYRALFFLECRLYACVTMSHLCGEIHRVGSPLRSCSLAVFPMSGQDGCPRRHPSLLSPLDLANLCLGSSNQGRSFSMYVGLTRLGLPPFFFSPLPSKPELRLYKGALAKKG